LRVPASEFLALDLEAHALLRGVPLRDVSAVDLPGGGSDRRVGDAKRLLFGAERAPGLPTRLLFGMRRLLGRVFGWDRETQATVALERLSEAQRRSSLTPPGSADGIFRLLYEFPNESVGEIRNATVHAFVCMALAPRASGYRFYLAVYVEPVSWLTPLYMAAIEPFRRLIVYPALLARLRAAWIASYPTR
jgi:hypothetical protein